MNLDVPDMTRSGGNRGHVLASSTTDAPAFAPQFTAVPPPQPTGNQRSADGRKVRAVGLLPAQEGAQFPLIIRDKPADRVSPKRMGEIRSELRKADAIVRRIEGECASLTIEVGANSETTRAKFLEFQAAEAKAGIWRRQWLEAEASSKGRPTQVHLATVHGPGEVPDALASTDSPPFVVCLHDGCRGQRWASEAAMRAAHPTDAEMRRTLQAHVYCYQSEAPIDATDPDGAKVGYIAPLGRDGSSVQMAAALAEEETGRDEEMAGLRKQLADLQALVETLAKGAKKA